MKRSLTFGIILLAAFLCTIGAWADDPTVGPGKKITVDYTLTVDNKQLESSVGKQPLVYIVGHRDIIPGLETQLNGMHMNEEKVVNVAPKDGYGEMDPKAVKEFPISALPKGLDPKVGLILRATAPDGSRFPATITQIKGDTMVLDFNHPLAGKNLTFKVKVLKIENAS